MGVVVSPRPMLRCQGRLTYVMGRRDSTVRNVHNVTFLSVITSLLEDYLNGYVTFETALAQPAASHVANVGNADEGEKTLT